MTNLNFIKTLTAGVALAMAIYPQAFATESCGTGYTLVGESCVKTSGNDCGTNCHWEIDKDGVLRISATGANAVLTGHAGCHLCGAWHASKELITEVVVESGIMRIGGEAFEYDNIKKITLPNTLTTLDSAAFHTAGIVGSVVIPESVTSIGNIIFYNNTSMTNVYCSSAQKSSGLCGASALTYERDENDNLFVYNTDGTLKGVYSDYVGIRDDKVVDSYEKENEQTGKTEVFNGRGVLTSLYAVNPDGSTSIYDTNGKLTGLKNAKSITPAQAAALVKKGNHNRVTLTFK